MSDYLELPPFQPEVYYMPKDTPAEIIWRYFPYEYYRGLLLKEQTKITDELLRGQAFGL